MPVAETLKYPAFNNCSITMEEDDDTYILPIWSKVIMFYHVDLLLM